MRAPTIVKVMLIGLALVPLLHGPTRAKIRAVLVKGYEASKAWANRAAPVVREALEKHERSPGLLRPAQATNCFSKVATPEPAAAPSGTPHWTPDPRSTASA
jgi:hypothetical protein